VLHPIRSTRGAHKYRELYKAFGTNSPSTNIYITAEVR